MSLMRMSTEEKLSPRDERRRILRSPNYNRMGFKDQKEDVKETMETYNSNLVEEMRKNGGSITRGDVTVKLAEYYGFCWGVERAIAMAYEVAHFRIRLSISRRNHPQPRGEREFG